MNELVSAIIITHNRSELAKKAVESVLKQTYSPIELIVVDDASEEAHKNGLEAFLAEKEIRYIYIPKAESKGGNHARNVGIAASSGGVIALLDDDDEWFPEKTEKQMRFLEAHPDIPVVHCGKVFEHDFKTVERRDPALLAEGDVSRTVWEKSLYLSSCLMLRKSVFDEIGLFDEELKFWQDYEFSMRAAKRFPLGVVREDLVLYRVISSDKGRLTNKLAGWEQAVDYILNKHADTLRELGPETQKRFSRRIYQDGVMRATTCGDEKAKRNYLWKLYKLEPSAKSFARFALNKEKLSR